MVTGKPHGPIDYMLIQFPGERFSDAVAEEILSLLSRDVVRLYDLMLVAKDTNGMAQTIDALEAPIEQVGAFVMLARFESGLLSEEDFDAAAAVIEPGSVAALLVFENSWAVPFVGAALDAGGDVVATARIPAQDVIDALDLLEAVL
jgi:hypothetical protein